MKHLPPLAAVCLLIVPSAVMAQQLSPNPNPAGNTIIVDTSTAETLKPLLPQQNKHNYFTLVQTLLQKINLSPHSN